MTKKKWILPVCIVCGVVLCLVAVIAFGISKDNEKGKSPNEGFGVNIHLDNPEPPAADPVDYDAQYIRTNAYHEGTEYPSTIIIRSVEELNAYYNTNKNKFDLERHDKVYSDTTIGFLDACDKYDETYFENHILVMVLLEEGSGSNRHKVDSVKASSDGTLYVSIRSIVPEAGTCDMAQWHILIELEADVKVESESNVEVYLDGVNPKKQPTTVREVGSFSNITLTIPYDWNYEIERGNNADEYCIAFWPKDQTEGKIKMWYYTMFGVCGTGLETEEITIGGYKARKGTYHNKKMWDFISFVDVPGSYVAMNEGADTWWNEYGEEAMQILSTVKLAEDIITEEQAIEIAKKQSNAKFNEVSAKFDTNTGIWTVTLTFKKIGNRDGVHVYNITHEGKIVDAIYGD